MFGKIKSGLYLVPISRPSRPFHQVASSVKVSPIQWYQRIGHPTSVVVKTILKSNNFKCSFDNLSNVCDACQRAKSHQLSYNKSVHVTSFPLELVHTYV